MSTVCQFDNESITCDASCLLNASMLEYSLPNTLFMYGINSVVPIFFSNARARIIPRCLGDAYCLVSVVPPNGCSRSSRSGTTSASLPCGWRDCAAMTSSRDANDLLPENPMYAKQRPIADVYPTSDSDVLVKMWASKRAGVSLLPFLRAFAQLSALYNITLVIVHIPGVSNTIADAISRQKFSKMRRLLPSAAALPTHPLSEVRVFF